MNKIKISQENVALFSEHMDQERFDYNLYVDGAGRLYEVKMGSFKEKILSSIQKIAALAYFFSLEEISKEDFSAIYDRYAERMISSPSQALVVDIRDYFL